MKIYNSFLTMVIVALSTLFTACSEDGYWDGYSIPETTYSFAQKGQSYSLTAADALSSVTVELYRNSTKGEVTLPLDIQTDNNLMTPQSESVTFADGSDTAQLIIDIDESGIVIGTTYKAVISLIVDGETLTEDNLSVTGPSACTVSVTKNYTWESAGKVVMTSYWAGVRDEILVEKAAEYNTDGNMLFRLVSPYYYLKPDYCPNPGYHIQFVVDANGNAVSVPVWQNIGEEYDAGYNFYLYCNPAQGGSFINQGNTYMITGLWAVRSDSQILGSVGEATELFEWVEGWPGE